MALCASATAAAAATHTVRPGETLWGIAAQNGLTPAALAGANGLTANSMVTSGKTLVIPAGSSSEEASEASVAPTPLGAYTVRPGDTLSAIAARSGVSVQQIAWMNGISPGAPLRSGTALKLPTATPGAGAVSTLPTGGPPFATPGIATAGEIGGIAAAQGVPSSLASAIGWQESGFNNSAVSSANARGVMQVMPGTFQWVQTHLAAGPLDPSSTADNVKAGVLYLGQLLRDTGGDPVAATAAYYQGLGSLRQIGMLPETRRYVANVMALRSRFGGP